MGAKLFCTSVRGELGSGMGDAGGNLFCKLAGEQWVRAEGGGCGDLLGFLRGEVQN